MDQVNRDTIDTAAASWVDVYRRLTDVVIPRPIALVATDGRLVEQAVQVGLRNWDWVEIREGLSVDQAVVMPAE